MGKFEKGNRPMAARAAQSHNAKSAKKSKKKTGLIAGCIAAGVVLVGAVAALLLLGGGDPQPTESTTTKAPYVDDGKILQNVYVAGVDLSGMTQEEARQALGELTFDHDLTVSLYTRGEEFVPFVTTYDPASETVVDIYGQPLENAQPVLPTVKDETAEDELDLDPDAPRDETGALTTLAQSFELSAKDVGVALDVEAAVEAALAYGREDGPLTEEPELLDRLDLDVKEFMTYDEDYILSQLELAAEDVAVEGTKHEIQDGTGTLTDEDGNPYQVDTIEITIGSLTRSLDVEALFDAVMDGYMTDAEEVRFLYTETYPEAIDLDALYAAYHCTPAVNAVVDPETYEMTESSEGFGFRMADAYNALSLAQPGDTVTLTLDVLKPQFTKEDLETELFSDVLASYSSWHVWNPNRTNNLELAAKAIDGTIIGPGEIFSFNDIVGERTASKGYKEAAVYVSGKTEDQLGGGICQVASTIYYCTLMADLETVERYEHQYLVTYVPPGMDATIYWGSLDFQWRNNTTHPIRVDASVSDGYVHIALVGTETKEYTVKLDYVRLSYKEAEEEFFYIWPEMDDYEEYKDYEDGEVIQTAYDGCKYRVYMYKYDLNGNQISKEEVNVSEYDLRNKQIAKLGNPDESTDDSSGEESTEPTESDPTESSSSEEPTESEPTESTSSEEPTESEPTESSSSEEPSEPTEP